MAKRKNTVKIELHPQSWVDLCWFMKQALRKGGINWHEHIDRLNRAMGTGSARITINEIVEQLKAAGVPTWDVEKEEE